MAKFRSFKIVGVRALYDNGLRISISESHLEISKVNPLWIKEELKTLTKQYEISEEEFQQEFKKLLLKFPEVKEVINAN